MLQDLKAACRVLAKSKWFTCVTVLTLALGIGANTAIFAVVNRLMLNPLPYPDADRIAYLRLAERDLPFVMTSYVVAAWREEARSFDGIEAYAFRGLLAHDASGARTVVALSMTPGLPAFLGVAPALGRGFTEEDAAPGAPAVAMLSYEAWQSEYGGAADVLGRTITLDRRAYVVVGVMPARAAAITRYARNEVWLPLSLDPSDPMSLTGGIEPFGRLRPDVPVDVALSELRTLAVRALEGSGEPRLAPRSDFVARLIWPAEEVNPNTRETMLVLLAAAALVLLVACSNVANLLLARGASRAREFALRTALGASTRRLVRALFAQCLVLALAAGAAGLVLGWVTLRIAAWLRPPILRMDEVKLDPNALVFTFGVSVATALVFGLMPAVRLAAGQSALALRHGAAGIVRSGRGPLLRKLLVAAQMSLSVVLLISAGLLVRSVLYLQQVDVGFDAPNLFSVELTLPRGRYEEPASREALSEQFLDRVGSLPGVAAATQASAAPPSVVQAFGAIEVGGRTPGGSQAGATTAFNHVRPDYFRVLGIPLLEGRTFTLDELRSRGVVVVSRAAAAQYWPDGNALGAELKWQQWTATVVGVVDDVVIGGLAARRDSVQFYWPLLATTIWRPTLMVRVAGDSGAAIALVRAAAQALDPDIVVNVTPTEARLARSVDGPRFNMVLLTAFAAIALVLAAVGLAAVIGYEVTERKHEMGIRMALGAHIENVRRQAMSHGLKPALVGVVLGTIGALFATELASSMLYGIAPRDPLTFVGVVALLLLVALGASWLPATRATRVDPIIALRAE
jgi:putative ABC transport system permease protein